MQHIAMLSYGKDSIAMLYAIRELHLPLDRIITADLWATDTIPADLPPMVEFKKYADEKIKNAFGIEVEHVCHLNKNGEKITYEKMFYHIPKRKNILTDSSSRERERERESILGFPMFRGEWCRSALKLSAIQRIPGNSSRSMVQKTEDNRNSKFLRGERKDVVQYLGIAADEPKRIERHKCKDGVILPLVEIGWKEDFCRTFCEEVKLLSPIYTDETFRGGCWFCHNQGVNQLRLLRHNYPEYWNLLLKWDNDSPVTFHADGHTVHDFDERFKMEDENLISKTDKFNWWMLNAIQLKI